LYPGYRLGPDHPNVLQTKNNLAGLYLAQRKNDRAEPLFRELLEAQTAKLGTDHSNVLQT
jgi:hypothetical protein